MFKGLGWGGGFEWDWGPPARLPEYFYYGAVFPQWALDAYPMHQHPGPPEQTAKAGTEILKDVPNKKQFTAIDSK